MAHIKAKDTVKIISGRQKGSQGKVIKVFLEKNSALVERLNFVKRHAKAGGQAGQQGGIIEKEAPIPIPRLMVVCPKCSKPSRTGAKVLGDGSKVRFCKKCKEQIDS
jgi:large subunit ribosomal protein L24